MKVPAVKWAALASLLIFVVPAFVIWLQQTFPASSSYYGAASLLVFVLPAVVKWLQVQTEPPPSMPPGAAGDVHFVPAQPQRSKVDKWWNG